MKSAFVSRKPWATVIVSLFLTPAIGMLYLGKWRLGIIYFVVMVFSILSATFFLPDLDQDIKLGLVGIVGAIHCYFVSRSLSDEIPKFWFARWYNILGLFVGLIFL